MALYASLAMGGLSTAKVAVSTVAALVSMMATWVMFAAEAVGGGDLITTGIPAGAISICAGALVWVMKQVVSGTLVHRDPATAEKKLADTSDRLAQLLEESLKREAMLTDFLLKRYGANRE